MADYTVSKLGLNTLCSILKELKVDVHAFIFMDIPFNLEFLDDFLTVLTRDYSSKGFSLQEAITHFKMESTHGKIIKDLDKVAKTGEVIDTALEFLSLSTKYNCFSTPVIIKQSKQSLVFTETINPQYMNDFMKLSGNSKELLIGIRKLGLPQLLTSIMSKVAVNKEPFSGHLSCQLSSNTETSFTFELKVS